MAVDRIWRWICDGCGLVAEREGYGLPSGWIFVEGLAITHRCEACKGSVPKDKVGIPRVTRAGILLGPRINIVGNEYGKLRVLGYDRAGFWWCRCDPELGGCGAEKSIQGAALRQGRQESCGSRGCRLAGPTTKHGHSPASGASPTYEAYRSLLSRHRDRLDPHWKGPDGFQHFLEDMGTKPDRHRLDIDGNGPIGPSSCRWVSCADRVIEIGRRYLAGESAACLATEYGVSRQRIYQIIKAWKATHPA